MTTGKGATEAPKIDCVHDLIANPESRTNRPILFVLLGGTEESREADAALENLLDDERVRTTAITSCVVVKTSAAESIDETHPFGKWLAGESLPRMVIFSAGHQRVGTVDASTSATTCYTLLKKAIALDFDVDVDARVREFGKRWSRITSLEDRLDALDEALAANPKDPPKAQAKKRKEVSTQLEAEQAEIAACYEMVPRKGSAADKSG